MPQKNLQSARCKEVYFERAIFISWYCKRGDCKFCYMSTQKRNIKDPKIARRTRESVLAEVILCKLFNWKIEFISGGYESYTLDELESLLHEIYILYGKVWLNMGVMPDPWLEKLSPYLEGVCGAVECINEKLRNYICPSKPLNEIEEMFHRCERLGLEKSMTIILGLGETVADFESLKRFIKKNKVSQVTFYRLKSQKGTIFEKVNPIKKEYYVEWVTKTRMEFPGLKIIVGSWIGTLDEISDLLSAGADAITKFPAVIEFGKENAKIIEDAVKKAGMSFKSNFTEKYLNESKKKEFERLIALLDYDNKVKDTIRRKFKEYLESMQ